jgi:hypothetical protein
MFDRKSGRVGVMYVYTYITCCIRYGPAPSSTRDDVRFVRFETATPSESELTTATENRL